MFERLLNKLIIPIDEQIKEYIGEEANNRLLLFEYYLSEHYFIKKELKFPFGNQYGWGYKYNHKTSHICYIFFEKNAFTVMIQIGDKKIKEFRNIYNSLLKKTQDLWLNRYLCGKNGGWIQYRVLSDEELLDIYKLIKVKKKNNFKI